MVILEPNNFSCAICRMAANVLRSKVEGRVQTEVPINIPIITFHQYVCVRDNRG